MVLVLVVEILFFAVFLRAVFFYLRRRDRVQREVMLIFAAVAALFLLGVFRFLGVNAPGWVRTGTLILLLGQPYFTIRLVALLGLLPRWVRFGALAAWLATSALLVAMPSTPRPTWVVNVMGAVFAVGELVAAGYFLASARRRAGSARRRLMLGGLSTLALAATLPAAVLGPVGGQVARVVGLLAAVGYVMTFMPPSWLRRRWSAVAVQDLTMHLLDRSPDENAAQTWQRYVAAVTRLTSCRAVVVALPAGTGLVVTAAHGLPPRLSDGEPHPPADVEDAIVAALATPGWRLPDPVAHRLADVLGLGGGPVHVTVAAIPMPDGRRGALILVDRFTSLFSEDDVALFGELGGAAAVLADRQALTDRLAAAVDAADAASAAKSQFVASMSHELRTPLNAIIGFSDLMRDEPAVGQGRAIPNEWIEYVHTSGQHLLALINDVLDLAKIEAGKVELRPTLLDSAELIDEVVASLRSLSDAKRLDIVVAVPPLPLRADLTRVRQILTNLLSNAIKFTPEAGSIFVAARRTGGEVAIAVSDTGPGIAPHDQQRIFEEFQQVGDPRMHKAGTGLGLALTRRLVEAHGGRIEVSSRPGHGSRFTVYLPAGGQSTPADNKGPGGILVVEDDAAAADLLAAHLRRAGYQVSIAGSGEEGLAAAARQRPEVILLDVILPGIDGWEVMRRIKADENLRHIPVAIISVIDDHTVGLALGAMDYFTKPINPDILLAWLVRHGMVPPLGADEINILVIDDDPSVLTMTQRRLARPGLRVVTAASGLDGLRLANHHRFDLIICDLIMPDLDGFSVIAALHEDPRTRTTPVLVLTSQDLSESDKIRLSGRILGIATKGADPVHAVQDWLYHLGELTVPEEAPVGQESPNAATVRSA